MRYASTQHNDANRWPKLTVTYTQLNEAYYLKDHLGNIRVTLDGNGNVLTSDDYYPFGLQMPGRSYNIAMTGNQYKFSGKELDTEGGLDWYYFGARYFDPVIGRFLSIDRFTDRYPSLTPYHYTANNPLIFIDINGDSLKAVKMMGLDKNDPSLKERTYYLDDNIADDVKTFVEKAREKFSGLSVNNTFRLGKSSDIKTKNTKAKGLSRHNAGFAIDLNGVPKLTTKQLKELNKLAKKYGLTPLKNQKKDLPHFRADYKKYFKTLKAAVDENKKHYKELTKTKDDKK